MYSNQKFQLDLPPDVLQAADLEFQEILNYKTKQSIVRTRESDSENTEYISFIEENLIQLFKNDFDHEIAEKIIKANLNFKIMFI